MRILAISDAARELARLSGKWVLFLSGSLDPVTGEDVPWNEGFKAAPYLDCHEGRQVLMDGHGFILCDSQEECETLFWQTVGDDGPTKANPYPGDKARVYACTIDPTGEVENENT